MWWGYGTMTTRFFFPTRWYGLAYSMCMRNLDFWDVWNRKIGLPLHWAWSPNKILKRGRSNRYDLVSSYCLYDIPPKSLHGAVKFVLHFCAVGIPRPKVPRTIAFGHFFKVYFWARFAFLACPFPHFFGPEGPTLLLFPYIEWLLLIGVYGSWWGCLFLEKSIC